jgi:hypothetical protein
MSTSAEDIASGAGCSIFSLAICTPVYSSALAATNEVYSLQTLKFSTAPPRVSGANISAADRSQNMVLDASFTTCYRHRKVLGSFLRDVFPFIRLHVSLLLIECSADRAN